MIEIKEDLMDSMIVTGSPVAYINGEKIVGEGFVLKNSSIIMKLVNREVFAFANFNTAKNWS
jgi:protein-disulfide isomerase